MKIQADRQRVFLLCTAALSCLLPGIVNGSSAVPVETLVDISGETVAPSLDGGLNEDNHDNEKEKETFEYWECRRNPTWKTGGVDREECERLTMWNGWDPRHDWVYDTSYFENGEEDILDSCLTQAFEAAIENEVWPR